MPNDLNLAKVKRVEDIDLANCFNDETKEKLPSEIKSPLAELLISFLFLVSGHCDVNTDRSQRAKEEEEAEFGYSTGQTIHQASL